jgi:glutamine---fructose-6-phosphate transaminase (isomerizing)
VDQQHRQRADIFCVGTRQAVASANVGIVLPDGVAEELFPIIEIVPVQQLALGDRSPVESGRSAGLRKVTETL